VRPAVLRRRALAGAALLAAAGPAAAQGPALPPPGAQACSGCHAVPARPGAAIPPIHDSAPAAIAEAMRAYRTGERSGTVMNRIARGFSDEESAAIAAWIGAAR
jgi:sulfide dehydrogenase cytochrome subunit